MWDFEGFRRWVSENSQKSRAAVRQSATLIQTTDRWNNQIHNVDERENFFDMTNQFLKEGCQSGVKQDDIQGQSISAAVSQSASVYPHRLSAGWQSLSYLREIQHSRILPIPGGPKTIPNQIKEFLEFFCEFGNYWTSRFCFRFEEKGHGTGGGL